MGEEDTPTERFLESEPSTYIEFALQRAEYNEQKERGNIRDNMAKSDSQERSSDYFSEAVGEFKESVEKARSSGGKVYQATQQWFQSLGTIPTLVITGVLWILGEEAYPIVKSSLSPAFGIPGDISQEIIGYVSPIYLSNTQLALIIVGHLIVNTAVRGKQLNALKDKISGMNPRQTRTDGGKSVKAEDNGNVETGPSTSHSKYRLSEMNPADSTDHHEAIGESENTNLTLTQSESEGTSGGGSLGGVLIGAALGSAFGPGGTLAGGFLGGLLGDRFEQNADEDIS
ncbi:hypothetical protein [Salarchaeum japonicum]|uniref:Uncharacterized protein n=1 Tax=Salarchaeum japonicum TaxID=555573 RepID=A0AAV3T0L2_9EURY|nr:hypothetical protein [Salarchaeum japonicum]